MADDISSLVSKSIAFIYDANTRPCDPPPPGATLLPLGSGFIVGLTKEGEPGTPWQGWKFLVTAHHVVAGRDSVILRFNSKDGSRLICYAHQLSWQGQTQNVFTSKKREVDLALISVSDIADTDPTVFDYGVICDDAMYQSIEIREGTDVYTVGYLWGYSGQKQNFPVTKFGRVALITNENWYKSPAPRNLDEQAYLIELQVTPGLSGAPVILKSPQFRVDDKGRFQFRKLPPFIIGVIKGLLTAPTGSQGVAAIEPARHLKEILAEIAEALRKGGQPVKIP